MLSGVQQEFIYSTKKKFRAIDLLKWKFDYEKKAVFFLWSSLISVLVYICYSTWNNKISWIDKTLWENQV